MPMFVCLFVCVFVCLFQQLVAIITLVLLISMLVFVLGIVSSPEGVCKSQLREICMQPIHSGGGPSRRVNVSVI